FDAQSQGQVPIGMAFRIEQPVTHSHPDFGQTPGEGLVPFRPAVLVEGRSGVDHRWNGEAAVESVGDAVGHEKIPGMGVVDDLGLVGEPIRLLLGTLKVSEGLKIAITAADLYVAGP